MGEEISFRELKAGEEAEVVQLVETVFMHFIAPDYSEEGVEEFLSFVDPKLIAERRKKEGNFILVAEVSKKIVGMIEIRDNHHISLLFVDKNYQRQGIARQLVNQAIARGQTIDSTITEWEVNASPNAVSIYEKLGFEVVDSEQEENGIRFFPMKLKLEKT